MGQVINFPSAINNDGGAIGMSRETRIIRSLNVTLAAVRRGIIKPDKILLLYQEGDTCGYLNMGYAADILVKSIDLVLEHGLKDES